MAKLRHLEASSNAQWGPQDGRTQAANRIAGALQSVMALRIFEISVFPHPNFWSDFFQTVPTPADLAGHQKELWGMDMRRLVGQNVRRLRLARGLTQKVLAERAGFTQQYISELENGRQNPTAVTLYELASQLGSTPAELVSPGPVL